MSENGMTCGEFADVAAELALGVLTGRERAQAVAHLDQCDSCREHVRQLSLTGEEMLGLLPSREPPEGFESRVMARLGVTAPDPGHPQAAGRGLALATAPGSGGSQSRKSPARWSRRMLSLAAVSLAVVACALGGWALRGVTGPSAGGGGSTAQAPLREATLTSATTRQEQGKVYLYDGSPRWLYMGIDTHDASDKTVICQLETRSGGVVTIGSFQLQGGYGAWGSPDPVAASDVTGARITSMTGTVLATARFTPSH